MSQLDFETMRRAMVASQLRTNAVNDPRVVAAMTRVPRERFVPAERAALAYVDRPVEVSAGRSLNPPMVTGRLLTEAQVRDDDAVLLVGAATGYTAALIAPLCRSIVVIEENAELAARCRANLAGIPNADLVEGALAKGHAASAPYDLVIIDGAVEHVPEAIVEQLADGGRLAAVVIRDGVHRLAIGRRAGAGFGFSEFADADGVPLPGFEKPRAFTF